MKINLLKIFLIMAFAVFLPLLAITSCSPGASAESSVAKEDINEKESGLKKSVDENKIEDKNAMEEEMVSSETLIVAPNYKDSRYKEIYLAGGCFWGVQAYIDSIIGIEYTSVGYANGESEETDYYSIKKTGHTETVYVVYDPDRIMLEELLGYFYGIIEPTSLNRQGNDAGTQYRTGIYYTDKEDKEIIDSVTQKEQAKYSEKIVTEIEPLKNYVLAEDYHQDYLDKNPGGYCHIDLTSIPQEKPKVSRAEYPKPPVDEIKEKLTDLQYSITQEDATESPFNNEYWDNKKAGIYVDIVTGEPLFLSINKYDSGTGWPSFTRPIQWDVINYYVDSSSGMNRIEVRSRSGHSHLGHLFYDGPVEEGGLRYCINSGSLDFIALDEMEEYGYGKFIVLFE
ncbi:MAG: peptide-methionine (R)-S-oxide reductase MsrB [Actinobacteria bacterium]|nr:peptide-methionine (R)-S-oxide reductase MsrB [Actinomycetota bacterium]